MGTAAMPGRLLHAGGSVDHAQAHLQGCQSVPRRGSSCLHGPWSSLALQHRAVPMAIRHRWAQNIFQ